MLNFSESLLLLLPALELESAGEELPDFIETHNRAGGREIQHRTYANCAAILIASVIVVFARPLVLRRPPAKGLEAILHGGLLSRSHSPPRERR